MASGTIISYDAFDTLGEIELEDGTRVRFGLSALADGLVPVPGTAVVVTDISVGFGGRRRATKVRDPARLLTPAERVESRLKAADTTAYQLREFDDLAEEDKRRLGRRLLDWTFTNRDLRSEDRPFVLKRVPLDLWNGDELVAVMNEVLAQRGYFDGEYFDRLLSQAKSMIGGDATAKLEEDARKRITLDEEDRKNPVAARIRVRPEFSEIERLFATTLPSRLREAWWRSYESLDDATPKFIFVKGDRVPELAEIARFITDEHSGDEDLLREVAGKPFPVLPFAESHQSADYFVLDLSRPTPSGDFPVLYLAHDVYDVIQEVAATSSAWLDDPTDPGDFRDDEIADDA